MLRLLIDTSVWLDLATSRDGQKRILPLRVLAFQKKLELLAPAVVIEEFDRNRPRLETAVSWQMCRASENGLGDSPQLNMH